MALFDNDFIETIVTEGKDCDKDCKKAKDVDDEKDEKDEDVEDVDDDAEEELSDDDKEEAEEAARFDVEEASSVEEMKGFSSALSDMARESHFTCLEFVGTTIALDKVDVACSESYVKASSIEEKEAVTEEFKENVKIYAQKFKAFILKIKNVIVRTYNRVKAYLVNLFDKVRTKVVSYKVKSLDTEKMGKAEKKMKVFSSTQSPIGNIATAAESKINSLKDIITKVTSLDSNKAESQYEDIKAKLEEFSKASKDDIRKDLLGNQIEVSVMAFKNALTEIDGGKKAIEDMNKHRGTVLKMIEDVNKSVSASKDIDSKVMAIKVTAINKLVSYLNKVWSVFSTAIHHWLAPRISVIMRYGKRQWKKGNESAAPAPKADDKKETKESWSLLDQFNAEW